MKISVKHNTWGNYNCYIGATNVNKFPNEIDAYFWITEAFLSGEYTISENSDFTHMDVIRFLVRNSECFELEKNNGIHK
jgi:hypothetical protein